MRGDNTPDFERLRIGDAVGERGLLIAIVAHAAIDYHCGCDQLRESAACFFRSDWYRHILDMLGVHPDALPVGISHSDL